MKRLIVMLCVSMFSVMCMAQRLAVSVYQPVYVEPIDLVSYAIGLLEGKTPSLDYSVPQVTPRAEPQEQIITKAAYYITNKGDLSKINIQITINVFGAHVSAVYNRNLKTWQKESHPIYEVSRHDNEFIYNNFEFRSSSVSYGTIYF